MTITGPALFAEDDDAAHLRLQDQLATLGEAAALDTRQRIALLCRFLAREGHAGSLAGQVTARADHAPGHFWTIAWDKGFANARSSRVILIDGDMNVVEGEGQPNPGVRFHLWIYHARPDLNAIVHSHPPAAAALSMTGQPLVAAHMDSAMFHDDCAYLPDWPGVPVANEEGRIIAGALGGKRSILLANHGILTTGTTLDEAAYLAGFLERACRMQLQAAACGGAIRPLEPERARKAHDFLLSPRLVEGTIAYWLEQTLRTDADALR